MTQPITTATVWGGAGMLAGAALATAVMLPSYPGPDSGFDGLGWILMWLALGAALGLVGGAWALHSGLRRARAEHVGRTVAAYVPLALLLASVTAGAGALLAPTLARWLVEVHARRTNPGPATWSVSRG